MTSLLIEVVVVAVAVLGLLQLLGVRKAWAVVCDDGLMAAFNRMNGRSEAVHHDTVLDSHRLEGGRAEALGIIRLVLVGGMMIAEPTTNRAFLKATTGPLKTETRMEGSFLSKSRNTSAFHPSTNEPSRHKEDNNNNH